MGGIIGALVVGLVLVVFLLMNNNQAPAFTNTAGNNTTGNVPNAQPTANQGSNAGGTDSSVIEEPTVVPAPRMTVDELKALYDDPARRPVVVDVRRKEAFQEGHIAGAINIPEADVASRLAEFPRDKLVVTYCQ